MNGAWASQTHWTSFKHKPPQPILLEECPLRALLHPPGEPKARAQRKAHILLRKHRAETRDVMTAVSHWQTGTNPSPGTPLGAAGSCAASRSRFVILLGDTAPGTLQRSDFSSGTPVRKPEPGNAPPHTPSTLCSAWLSPCAPHPSSQHHSTAAHGHLSDTATALGGSHPNTTMGHQTGDTAFSHSPGDTQIKTEDGKFGEMGYKWSHFVGKLSPPQLTSSTDRKPVLYRLETQHIRLEPGNLKLPNLKFIKAKLVESLIITLPGNKAI